MKLLFERVEDVRFAPGAGTSVIRMGMPDANTLTVEPWVFEEGEMEFEVPGRAVEKRAYRDGGELGEAYRIAGMEAMRFRVRAC